MNSCLKTEGYHCPLCGVEETTFFITDFNNNTYWKCKKCRFVFQRPISQQENDADAWTNAIDPDGKTRDLTKERNFKLKNWYGGIVKQLMQMTPGKIIDVGCGLGYLLSDLPTSWEKYGIEPSEFARSFVKANFPDIQLLDSVHLETSPPPPEHCTTYDVAVCYHVMEHCEHPDIFLKHLGMLLKPGGTLVIGTPNIESIAARMFKGNFRLLNNSHRSLFNSENLETLLGRCNFRTYRKEYPFFQTDYFTFGNILRMFNRNAISPPFYGNIMTFYAKKET